jgi:hypothetical protein
MVAGNPEQAPERSYVYDGHREASLYGGWPPANTRLKADPGGTPGAGAAAGYPSARALHVRNDRTHGPQRRITLGHPPKPQCYSGSGAVHDYVAAGTPAASSAMIPAAGPVPALR